MKVVFKRVFEFTADWVAPTVICFPIVILKLCWLHKEHKSRR